MDRIVYEPLAALQAAGQEAARGNRTWSILVYHGPRDSAERFAAVKGIRPHPLHPSNDSRHHLSRQRRQRGLRAGQMAGSGVLLVNAETKANWSLGRIDVELAPEARSSAKHKLIYLDRRYTEDPVMVTRLRRLQREVSSRPFLQSSQAVKKQMPRPCSRTRAQSRRHEKAAARARTPRADEVQGLPRRNLRELVEAPGTPARSPRSQKTHQDYDPECISCHATGVAGPQRI